MMSHVICLTTITIIFFVDPTVVLATDKDFSTCENELNLFQRFVTLWLLSLALLVYIISLKPFQNLTMVNLIIWTVWMLFTAGAVYFPNTLYSRLEVNKNVLPIFSGLGLFYMGMYFRAEELDLQERKQHNDESNKEDDENKPIFSSLFLLCFVQLFNACFCLTSREVVFQLLFPTFKGSQCGEDWINLTISLCGCFSLHTLIYAYEMMKIGPNQIQRIGMGIHSFLGLLSFIACMIYSDFNRFSLVTPLVMFCTFLCFLYEFISRDNAVRAVEENKKEN